MAQDHRCRGDAITQVRCALAPALRHSWSLAKLQTQLLLACFGVVCLAGCTLQPLRVAMACCCFVVAEMQVAHPLGMRMGLPGTEMGAGSGTLHPVQCQQGGTSTVQYSLATGCTSQEEQSEAAGW